MTRHRVIHIFSPLKRLLNEKGHRYYYVSPVLHSPIKIFIHIVAPMAFDMLQDWMHVKRVSRRASALFDKMLRMAR